MTNLATHPDSTTSDPDPTDDDAAIALMELLMVETPTHEQMIQAVITTHSYDHVKAREFIRFLEGAVDGGVREGRLTNDRHLREDHIQIFHPLMDLIMKGGTPSAPGSLHRFLERGLAARLPRHAPGSLTVLHTKGDDGPEDCVTRVTVTRSN